MSNTILSFFRIFVIGVAEIDNLVLASKVVDSATSFSSRFVGPDDTAMLYGAVCKLQSAVSYPLSPIPFRKISYPLPPVMTTNTIIPSSNKFFQWQLFLVEIGR